jgi:hypothetical protein
LKEIAVLMQEYSGATISSTVRDGLAIIDTSSRNPSIALFNGSGSVSHPPSPLGRAS